MTTGKQIEELARRLALARGHKDADAEIVCVGGKREPVWRFYRDDAYDQICRCISHAPELIYVPTPCLQCGATTEDEANARCTQTQDETGDYYCAGDFDGDGISVQPTPESSQELDRWIEAHAIEKEQRR